MMRSGLSGIDITLQECLHQVSANGAADAAVLQADYAGAVMPALIQEFRVDIDRAEVIDHDEHTLAMLDLQKVVEQSGLAGAQKTPITVRGMLPGLS